MEYVICHEIWRKIQEREMEYLTLTRENIEEGQICCAFSDKKCAESYELKKQWLTAEFGKGVRFSPS